jgi:hypothetical protein
MKFKFLYPTQRKIIRAFVTEDSRICVIMNEKDKFKMNKAETYALHFSADEIYALGMAKIRKKIDKYE